MLVIVGHAARDPVARPEARFFGPAQTRPGPVHFVPGLARPVPRARAWAGTPARGPTRPGTELAGRPVSGPLTPMHGASGAVATRQSGAAQPSWPGEGALGQEYITHPPAAPPARIPSPHSIPAGERRPTRPHPLPPPACRLPFRLL